MVATRSRRTTLELIQSSAQGDQRSITELVMETSPEFVDFVAKRTSHDPEVIVNEVLAKVLHKLPELEISSANEFRAYVYRSLRNRLADEGRKRRLELVPLDQAPESYVSAPSQEGSVDNRMSIHGWLDALTPDQRAVISSRFLHDLSLEETAQRVGKPVPAVKSLQSRALQSLRLAAGVAVLVAVVAAGLIYSRARAETERLQPVSSDLGTIDDRRIGPDRDVEETRPDRQPPERSPEPPAPGPVQASPEEASQNASPGVTTTVPGNLTGSGGGSPQGGDQASSPVADGAPSTTSQPAPSTTVPPPTTVVAPTTVPLPRCVALEGASSVAEGNSAFYRLVVDRATDEDRTYTLRVASGTAGWVGNRAGVGSQDIMWGGYYTHWTWSLMTGWVQQSTVSGRVPDDNGVLATTATDRPMVGPADASWDYSIVVNGVIQDTPSVTVTVRAGETRSTPVEVRAWTETITVDRHGVDDGRHTEAGESLTLSGEGCSQTIGIQDASSVTFVNDAF